MTKSLQYRVAILILAVLIPPAIVLGILAYAALISWVWAAVGIGVGGVAGAVAAAALFSIWTQNTQRIASVASALAGRRPPVHFRIDPSDPMSRAQRLLLEAADSVVKDLRRLSEEAGEFEAILRGMTEAVVVTSASGAVVLLNGAARQMFALSADTDYRGHDFVELCRDPRLQEFVSRATAAATVSDGGDSYKVASAEIMIQNPAVHHLSVNATPLKSAQVVAAAWVFVFHDITQLKVYETMRADFITNLTHELRTPLSALCGYAETLMDGVEEPETRQRFLGIIERQARRLSRLIDDLISLSSLERGFTALKLEPLDPCRALAEAVDLMREQAARQGVALNLKLVEGLPEISADRDRIQQVLLNLIDNAIKYTPRGGQVTVEARAEGAGEGHLDRGVALIVADTGEGIPAADIPRLTERFYRVDRARSRELGGTGLGLAIVKHIVQLHHGQLKIESRLREGATFTVWIPAAEAAQ